MSRCECLWKCVLVNMCVGERECVHADLCKFEEESWFEYLWKCMLVRICWDMFIGVYACECISV